MKELTPFFWTIYFRDSIQAVDLLPYSNSFEQKNPHISFSCKYFSFLKHFQNIMRRKTNRLTKKNISREIWGQFHQLVYVQLLRLQILKVQKAACVDCLF